MEKNSYKEIWETYSKSWSETDCSKRLQMFKQCLNPDCVYTDPLTQTAGYEGLTDYMMEFQKNIPGGRFVITDFQEHHTQSLARWDMIDGKGNLRGQGASFAVYGGDGRLKQMTGFFEFPNAG